MLLHFISRCHKNFHCMWLTYYIKKEYFYIEIFHRTNNVGCNLFLFIYITLSVKFLITCTFNFLLRIHLFFWMLIILLSQLFIFYFHGWQLNIFLKKNNRRRIWSINIFFYLFWKEKVLNRSFFFLENKWIKRKKPLLIFICTKLHYH